MHTARHTKVRLPTPQLQIAPLASEPEPETHKEGKTMDNGQRDPVCNMEIDEQSAAGRAQYDGQTYYFCTQSCKDEFEQNPQRYVKQGAQGAGQSA